MTPFLRKPQKSQPLVIAFDDGGLGDSIARLPAIPYILTYYPHIDLTLVVQSYFKSIAKRSLPKSRKLRVIDFDEAKNLPQMPVKSFQHTGFYNNLSTHLTDHAFRILISQDVPIEHRNYLPIKTSGISVKRFGLPEKYVVIPTGYTAKVREMRPEVVNGITTYLVEKGYTPVFLGKKEAAAGITASGEVAKIEATFSDEIDFSIGIDLRDKTTILETVKIIGESSAICGLDNGLLHIAGCTDVPIVGGFTTVDPNHRMPYRNGKLGDGFYPVILSDEELACNFCQSRCSLTIKHPNKDFRYCIYDDYECTKLLTAEKYIEQLDKLL